MAIPSKRVKVEECSSDKNYWMIFFHEKTTHGENMTRSQLHELYVDLRELFKEENE